MLLVISQSTLKIYDHRKKSIHEYLNIRLTIAGINNWRQSIYLSTHEGLYNVGIQMNFTVIRNDLLAINIHL